MSIDADRAYLDFLSRIRSIAQQLAASPSSPCLALQPAYRRFLHQWLRHRLQLASIPRPNDIGHIGRSKEMRQDARADGEWERTEGKGCQWWASARNGLHHDEIGSRHGRLYGRDEFWFAVRGYDECA